MKHAPHPVDTITELHNLFFLPPPENPLITVINLKGTPDLRHVESRKLVVCMYAIWFMEDVTGVVRYGQRAFDFRTGTLTFHGPGQVVSMHNHSFSAGWGVVFHPDLLLSYPMKKYAFFSYEVYQGLHLSEKEDQVIRALVADIAEECHTTSPVLMALLELLLARLHRIYLRQFNPGETDEKDILKAVEAILDNNHQQLLTVKYIADQLRISPHYLSDKLKEMTGESAQKHIHTRMVEKAKHLLTGTTLSISEIAFRLGFEHMQSFSKIFKRKTGMTPRAFRNDILQ
jgi:AraC-like DNA-binding protein